MVRSLKVFVAALLLAAPAVQARTWAYKFQIQPVFGVNASCNQGGERELSQIRLYFDDAVAGSRAVTPTLVKLTVCLLGGGYVKDFFTLPIPSEVFMPSAPLRTQTVSVQHESFDAVEMTRLSPQSLKLRFLKRGAPWSLIDELIVGFDGRKKMQSLRLHLVKQNKWIDASLRLVE